MNTDEIIDQAIRELKEHDKHYKMFKDFSFMSELEWEDDKFQKMRHLIINSTPFEKHTDQSIKLSAIGLKIANDHKDWYSYKKSLKPKLDYAKWTAIVIALLSLGWNIYQGLSNNSLQDENKEAKDKIELLEGDNKRLTEELNLQKATKFDSVEKKVNQISK